MTARPTAPLLTVERVRRQSLAAKTVVSFTAPAREEDDQ